jgi:hypothetical protein
VLAVLVVHHATVGAVGLDGRMIGRWIHEGKRACVPGMAATNLRRYNVSRDYLIVAGHEHAVPA